jgi:hypothetical protein
VNGQTGSRRIRKAKRAPESAKFADTESKNRFYNCPFSLAVIRAASAAATRAMADVKGPSGTHVNFIFLHMRGHPAFWTSALHCLRSGE